MPNFFDQFDSETQESTANFFDKFDEIITENKQTNSDIPPVWDPSKPVAPEEVEESRSTIDNLIGGAEAGLTALTGATTGQALGVPAAIAGVIGDLAGVLTPKEAKDLYEKWVSKGTYQPKTEAALDILSSVGEITDTLPPIMGGAPPATLRGAGIKPKSSVDIDALKQIEKPVTLEGTREAVLGTKGSGEQLEQLVQPDLAMIKAREELGYTEKGTPAMVSKSRKYRETEGGLASQMGSDLDEQQFKFIQEHEKKADDLLKKGGGIRDASVFDETVREESKATIKQLGEDSDALYKDAFKTLDESGEFGATVNTESIFRDLESKAKKIGKGDVNKGLSKLTPLEKRMYEETKPEMTGIGVGGALRGDKPQEDFTKGSFYNLDRIRKDVGQSMGGMSGVFKDEEKGNLSRYYAMLSDAQEKAAREVSPDAADKIQKGKQLVIKRKDLEDQAVQMFGKDLDKSFQSKFQGALVSAANGNPTNFGQLLKSVPQNQKQSAIMTGLYKAMQGGRREMGVNPKAAADFWSNIKKQPTVMKSIMRELEPQQRRELNQWFKVNEGLSRALSSRTFTGRAATSSAFLDNLTSGLSDLAYNAAVAKTGGAGGLVVDLAKGAVGAAKNRRAQKAINMLTDESFLKDLGYIVKSEAGKRRNAAESKLMKNKRVNEWLETLSDADLNKVYDLGLIGFLSQEDESTSS